MFNGLIPFIKLDVQWRNYCDQLPSVEMTCAWETSTVLFATENRNWLITCSNYDPLHVWCWNNFWYWSCNRIEIPSILLWNLFFDFPDWKPAWPLCIFLTAIKSEGSQHLKFDPKIPTLDLLDHIFLSLFSPNTDVWIFVSERSTKL